MLVIASREQTRASCFVPIAGMSTSLSDASSKVPCLSLTDADDAALLTGHFCGREISQQFQRYT